ncbi:MAG: glycerol-3-phosphate dehydrogenase/oxidase [Lysinibacillus sp.]
MTFTVLNRHEQIDRATEETFDLLVIGGGITGAGIALDAAARGLSVVLLEMQDFAEGTSSRSTKLVHGGLRYLKQFEIKEVAELGRERAIVYENAPHVTTPVWMLLPFHKGGTFGQFTTALGLKVYDVLAGVKKGERRFMLSKDETLEREPLVKTDGLLGGGVYVEYRTDDARLTIEVLKSAHERGATLFNYMKAVEINTNNLAFKEVVAEDALTCSRHTFKARKVVNAAGPWVDEVRKLDGEVSGKHLILSKGVHVVFDQADFPLRQAIYFDTADGRMVFAIPREGKTYVGTTDTFHEGDPGDMKAEQSDIDYLLGAIAYMFPSTNLTEEHIESTWAGVRPLIHEEGKAPSEISRKDEIWQSSTGVITIAGGKLTGYRKMAEKIVDLIVQQLEAEYSKTYRSCTTKKMPLSGGDLSGSKHFEAYIERSIEKGMAHGLSREESEHLARLYGTNIDQVLGYAKDASSLPKALYAQLLYGIHHESVAKPVDFFIRRTGSLFFNIAMVEAYQEAVIDEMQRLLGWKDDQKNLYAQELEAELKNAKV